MGKRICCGECVWGEPVTVTGDCFGGESLRLYLCTQLCRLSAGNHPCPVWLVPVRPKRKEEAYHEGHYQTDRRKHA